MTSAIDALKRAVETDLTCHAGMWFANTLTGEPYEWTTCNLAPGHRCNHQDLDSDGNAFVSWAEGCVPEGGHRHYSDVFHHTTPSPWTADELSVLATVGGTYNNEAAWA
jgi:hypothetical protein